VSIRLLGSLSLNNKGIEKKEEGGPRALNLKNVERSTHKKKEKGKNRRRRNEKGPSRGGVGFMALRQTGWVVP